MNKLEVLELMKEMLSDFTSLDKLDAAIEEEIRDKQQRQTTETNNKEGST